MATTLYDLISIKLQLGDETRRLKLPLKDLTPSILPTKLRGFLNIPASKNVIFERYSDSAGAYVTLDVANQAVYKQLYRAAKAKAKLRIKVVVTEQEENKSILIETTSEEKEIPIIKSALAVPTPSIPNSVPQTSFAVPIPIQTPRKIEVSRPTIPEPVSEKITAAPLKSWTGHLTSFSVQCNHCNETIPGAHYHCDICEDSDFDLCGKCVDSGVHCDVDAHYLIKRTIVDGKISNSTSYKVSKKTAPKVEKKLPTKPELKSEVKIPGAFQTEIKEPFIQYVATRTCNSCVNSYPEAKFITCTDCEDYDLCEPCFASDKHGHHPAHNFKPVDETRILAAGVPERLVAGRGLRHFASCDGCDANIFGVRHKCLTCPDFDYCGTCYLSARQIHPGHRFAPIYDHIGFAETHKPLHNYIRCDGPHCMGTTEYIRGDRYKCAVCPDTDFCATCEASPANGHCRTHPLIKLRTPVRNVSVTTFGEDGNGEVMTTMGDKPPPKLSKSTETTPAKSSNAATQVQTIAEIKPSPKIESVKDVPAVEVPVSPVTEVKPQLQAHFVCDTIVDGSRLEPGQLYTQVWTLRNPGPLAWPAGCTVRYTGGDNMLNLDIGSPALNKDVESAVSSNTCPEEVVPGQEVRFEVTIKTPKTPGRSISYWRLKTPQGFPFGHKLWVDVEVKPEQPKAESKPEEKADEEVKSEPALETSQMVFPTLEKESPASSTIINEAAKARENTGDDVEFLDDLEHLELSDDDESEDAFLTDEEYEMLDTDSAIEEAVNGKNKK